MRNPNLPYIRALYPRKLTPIRPKHLYLLNHSLEAPAKRGLARSLAEGWWQEASNETSVHQVVDPGEAIQTYPFGYKVWGCGNGNDYCLVQTEHVGYAAWSHKQWRTPDMLDVMRISAKIQAWAWFNLGMKGMGIDYYPEFLTLAEIGHKSGSITHNLAREKWGGTTHTDPGPNFFYAELTEHTHKELDRLTGRKPTKPKPKPQENVYTVERGDTLSGIALRFDTTVGALVRTNNIKDPDLIYINEKLDLPDNSKPEPVTKPFTPPPARGKWPLSSDNFFGNIQGGSRSHGGYYTWEKPYVRWIQTRLIELDYADEHNFEVDGIFGDDTERVVTKWQMKQHRSTTSLPGEVWSDDYAHLRSYDG